ncbi:MAG TPA: Sec-independent protein translocase protein TatB [Alphaproteobacteria bacterium]|nr:Sec-independent protein translocase protein TatB [Alphaproteobacteria bacterium]
MLDFSWSEILLIAVVTLMVVRPKDLPQVLKYVAQFARKARAMAREFQSGVEDMVREAELHEVKSQIESAVSTDLAQELDHSIDPGGTIAQSLDLQAETAASVEAPALPAPPSADPTTPSAEVEAAGAGEAAALNPALGGEPQEAPAPAPAPQPNAAPLVEP